MWSVMVLLMVEVEGPVRMIEEAGGTTGVAGGDQGERSGGSGGALCVNTLSLVFLHVQRYLESV